MQEHTHGNTHSHGISSDRCDKKELVAMLRYMVSHNRAHNGEVQDVAGQLDAAGEHYAASLMTEALQKLIEGNDMLAAALDLLGEE